jgi:hypothetical protein
MRKREVRRKRDLIGFEMGVCIHGVCIEEARRMLVLLIGLCNIIREQLQAVLPPLVNCQIHSSASNFARDMVLNSDAAASGISTRDSQNNFMSFIIVPSTTTQQQPHFRCFPNPQQRQNSLGT